MDQNNSVIFPDGLNFYQPHHQAPSFIKGEILIQPQKLVAFLKDNKQHMTPKGYFKFVLKESKGGNLYLSLDTYKPAEKFDKTPDPEKTYAPAITPAGGYPEEIRAEDVPF